MKYCIIVNNHSKIIHSQIKLFFKLATICIALSVAAGAPSAPPSYGAPPPPVPVYEAPPSYGASPQPPRPPPPPAPVKPAPPSYGPPPPPPAAEPIPPYAFNYAVLVTEDAPVASAAPAYGAPPAPLPEYLPSYP
nr:leucine-rich repeat extensin-like protein 3 [Lepeophtheirus salmonis]